MWPRRQRSGKRFQSTPARSRRRLFPAIIGLVLDFNPLQREAGDDQEPFTPRIILISIHSSAKPETGGILVIKHWRIFQSTPARSRRRGFFVGIIIVRIISIHSSAKPETSYPYFGQKDKLISIHSSAKPETRRIRQPQYIILISIHSSAKPETAIITNFHLYSTHFLIQINQYFIFSTPFLHQSLYHNALFPVRIP